MKKIIAVVLVIVSIFSLATSAMAACTCSTSKPGVNVRKKANQSSSAVGNVAKGTSVSVLCTTTGTDLNKDGNKIWYYVQVLSCASGSKNNINGKYGYIHSSLISGFNANQLDHPQIKTLLLVVRFSETVHLALKFEMFNLYSMPRGCCVILTLMVFTVLALKLLLKPIRKDILVMVQRENQIR